jgi:hypothetical protein
MPRLAPLALALSPLAPFRPGAAARLRLELRGLDGRTRYTTLPVRFE